jgi:hypothetical protein
LTCYYLSEISELQFWLLLKENDSEQMTTEVVSREDMV